MASATFSQTPTPRASAALDLYWRVSGIALATLAAVGILLVSIGQGDLLGGFLAFDAAHNVVHALLAAFAIALGFGTIDPRLVRNAARVLGGVYLALALVGFLSADLFGLGDVAGLGLDLGENLLHLTLGAWGLYAGFAG